MRVQSECLLEALAVIVDTGYKRQIYDTIENDAMSFIEFLRKIYNFEMITSFILIQEAITLVLN